ncbi:tetrahydrofolate dehydrogenase/cyclohydrolase catalytic domain-containing protein [Haloarculaceae archaeon H-GB11]|nr:tetrahydrofolate dehydrogenase/cyclohydrolase catalytic domain-containing protein [Haloarculaceae archaeon H-GB11]
MATVLDGEPVATSITERVRSDLSTLTDDGPPPTLGTVLMSDAAGANRFMDVKHEACDAFGLDSRDVRVAPTAPASDLYDAIEDFASDPDVDAIFVQIPLPDHVDESEVRRRIPPAKDVDCFSPLALGRALAGEWPIEPVTPRAIRRLLAHYDVETVGADVTIVGRSTAIGRPLANMLLQRGPGGDATVTVCHTSTRNLTEKTRRADLLITACGVPELLGRDAVGAGATVVDVSANRIDADSEQGYRVVGDVDHEAVRESVDALTPTPGGVGPVTKAVFLENVVTLAAARRADR